MIQQRYTTLTLRRFWGTHRFRLPVEKTCKQTMQGWQPKDTKGIILGTLCSGIISSCSERWSLAENELFVNATDLRILRVSSSVLAAATCLLWPCQCLGSWTWNSCPWNEAIFRGRLEVRCGKWCGSGCMPHIAALCPTFNACKSLDSPSEWLCFVGENIVMNCLAMNFWGILSFRESHSFVCFFLFFSILV